MPPERESGIGLARLKPFGISDVSAHDPSPPPAVGSAVALRDLAEEVLATQLRPLP